MKNLMTKEYWDGKYVDLHPTWHKKRTDPPKRLWKRVLMRLFGGWLREYCRSYMDYLLWEVVYRKHLPGGQDLKVVEIGSAPGLIPVRLMHEFGYVPYGVEYSDQGVELNRRVFAEHGIPPENVIHADVFLEDFRNKYKESFDIVVSWSFIEHFTEARKVVESHYDLVKPGGTLVVAVPNHKGINGSLLKLMNRELYDKHNLDIMDKAVFRRLFDIPGLTPVYCNHCGTFSLRLWSASEKSLLRFPMEYIKRLEPYMGVFQRLIFRSRGFETGLSPWLLFIGKKQAKRG